MLERPTILDVLDLLGQLYREQNNPTLANVMARDLTDILKATRDSAQNADPLSKSSADALKNMGEFAKRFIEQGRNVEAEDLLTDVEAGYRLFLAGGVNAGQDAAARASAGMTTNNSGNDSSVSAYQQFAGTSQATQDIATVLSSAAMAYSRKEMDIEAEKILKKVLDTNQEFLGSGAWDTQRSVWRLASWYMERAKYDKALITYEYLTRIQGEAYGMNHTITRTTMVDIVGNYWDRFRRESDAGRKEKLRLLLETNLKIRKSLLAIYSSEPDGATSGNARPIISNIGSVLAILGRYSEAETQFTQLIEILDTAVDAQQDSKPAASANLGWTQFHQQKFSAAEETLRDAKRRYVALKSETWERYNTESMLGAVLVASGKYDEAQTLLTNSYSKLLQLQHGQGPASGFTAEQAVGERILTLYTKWGKPLEAQEWRRKIEIDKARRVK